MSYLKPAAAFAALVALTACNGPAQPAAASNPSTPPAATSPSTGGPAASPAAGGTATAPDPAAIFAAFQAGGGYEKVNTSPIKSGPHQGDVDIYVDKANAAKFKTVGATAPAGMTVVKVSVQDPKRMYLMKKVAGYDPANNDWYYANTTASGSLALTGKPQMCISCHAGYKSTDYLGAPALPAAQAVLK